ncbi:MAG: hypothetical protein ACI9TF_000388 [Paracrocinitomix sp.]|jgi:hypothetical protein|tara:strand:- start:323 stop:796 length:474 start_codon:yes stop_codon:yes gene_type:complete
MVKTNDRARRRFANLIAPDVRIEAVVLLKRLKGPNTAKRSNVLALYTDRYGLTNTLGSHSMLGDQWLVLTENHFLLFAKRGGGIVSRIGPCEHALHRTEVELQWADFTEATLHKRLLHLTTTDHRMNISQTVVTNDEADLLVQAVGDRSREIGLQEL